MPSKDEQEILNRLGTSALDAVPEKELEGKGSPTDPGNPPPVSSDPYGSGNYKDPRNEKSQAPGGESDKTGWGNQGNWGNEGYFQGYESRNEDRTDHSQPMPDTTEKAHETTKQRDRG